MAQPSRKNFTIVILQNLYSATFDDDEVGYEDAPSVSHYKVISRFNLETASRSFLSVLLRQLEKHKAEPGELPTGDDEVTKELTLLTPIDDILPMIREILDRTPEIILTTRVASPETFYQSARYLKDLQCRVTLGHRSFVLPVALQLSRNFFGTSCYISCSYWMHDQHLSFTCSVDPTTFKNGGMTIQQVFEKEGAPLATPEEVETYTNQMQRYSELQSHVGEMMDIETSVFQIARRSWRMTIEELHLGKPGNPCRLILEPELEVSTDLNRREGALLPLVRCFSPSQKSYVYAHVDELRPHRFDVKAKTRVVLPAKTRALLDQVFEISPDRVFGDMFGGRHGGVIVLSSGPSGVGKTITAEAFAESCSRPLYVLGIGELGTDASTVEATLSLVFDRVRRWNAVLLLDEGDIFLTKRQAEDLERSAIVGVFLRVLDSYQGILMITTNRPEVLDPALLTRVTLHFEYPDFGVMERQEVWKNLLEGAGIAIPLKDLQTVSEFPLNGRLIRNVVRLIGIHYPNRTDITVAEITDLFEFTTYKIKPPTP